MNKKNPTTCVSLSVHSDFLVLNIHRRIGVRRYMCINEVKKYNPLERHKRMKKIVTRSLQKVRRKTARHIYQQD